jgi:putative hydrolase of the HAD superfamily
MRRMSARLDAVVFDWGGTLTPYHDVDLADLWSAAAGVLAPARTEEMTAALVAVETEFWARAMGERGAHSATLEELLQLAAERVGLDVGATARDGALGAHLEAWTPHTVVEPDAAPALRALRERGMRIGLLSNTHWPREWHERFLARDGVLDLIDARVYTSDLCHTKPHAEAFRAVLAQLGVTPERALMVGDRPIDDISGAKALGMRAVLRPNGHVPTADVVPDATIEHLSELPAIIDRWQLTGVTPPS